MQPMPKTILAKEGRQRCRRRAFQRRRAGKTTGPAERNGAPSPSSLKSTPTTTSTTDLGTGHHDCFARGCDSSSSRRDSVGANASITNHNSNLGSRYNPSITSTISDSYNAERGQLSVSVRVEHEKQEQRASSEPSSSSSLRDQQPLNAQKQQQKQHNSKTIDGIGIGNGTISPTVNSNCTNQRKSSTNNDDHATTTMAVLKSARAAAAAAATAPTLGRSAIAPIKPGHDRCRLVPNGRSQTPSPPPAPSPSPPKLATVKSLVDDMNDIDIDEEECDDEAEMSSGRGQGRTTIKGESNQTLPTSTNTSKPSILRKLLLCGSPAQVAATTTIDMSNFTADNFNDESAFFGSTYNCPGPIATARTVPSDRARHDRAQAKVYDKSSSTFFSIPPFPSNNTNGPTLHPQHVRPRQYNRTSVATTSASTSTPTVTFTASNPIHIDGAVIQAAPPNLLSSSTSSSSDLDECHHQHHDDAVKLASSSPKCTTVLWNCGAVIPWKNKTNTLLPGHLNELKRISQPSTTSETTKAETEAHEAARKVNTTIPSPVNETAELGSAQSSSPSVTMEASTSTSKISRGNYGGADKYTKKHGRCNTDMKDTTWPDKRQPKSGEKDQQQNAAQLPTKALPPCPCPKLPPRNTALWPQAPLLFRPTPGSGTKVVGVRFDKSLPGNYLWTPGDPFTWMQALHRHWGRNKSAILPPPPPCCGYCATLPINNANEAEGDALVIDFESAMFVGSLLLRIRYSEGTTRHPYDDGIGFFHKRNLRYQAVIRGRFRSHVLNPLTEFSSGYRLSRPCGKLPAKWVLWSGLKVVSFFAPQMRMKLVDIDRPYCFTPLGSTPRTIVVEDNSDQPGDDKDPWSAQRSNHVLLARTYHEPTSMQHSIVGKTISISNTLERARARKRIFDQWYLRKRPTPRADPSKIYTMEFLQHLFDYRDFSIDVPGRLDVCAILDGQPLQLLTEHDGTEVPLWSFDLYHERLMTLAKE